MTIAPRTKAALVSARELPGLVDAAVKAAAIRAKIPEVEGPVVVKWELVGRVLRDLKQAQPFADGVVAELGAKGVKASPAILTVDKKILAGFFEKIAVPQLRQF